LTSWAIAQGAVSAERRKLHEVRETAREGLVTALQETTVASADIARGGAAIVSDGTRQSLYDWLRFGEIDYRHVRSLLPEVEDVPEDIRAEVLQDCRYAPYLIRQDQEIARVQADAAICLERITDYRQIGGLSNEMVERLNRAMPGDLAAAGRIRGVTPAALAAIMVHARRLAA
jgi:tRNA uridine 5-carboxymethylaminomethyl modification enzyme